jgi:hypothetical protein
MVASSSSPSSSSSTSPVLSSAHRRRLADVERDVAGYCTPCDDSSSEDDDGHRGHGAGAVRALFFTRRNKNKPLRVSVVDQAWVRNAVACLLFLTVVVGLLSSHHQEGSRRLVRRVDAGEGEVMLRWREDNLTAVARRHPPETPVSTLRWNPRR